MLFTLVLLSAFLSTDEIKERAYLQAYESSAISEMHTHGIPASIKLAQALVESNAGRSLLATRANNHFGIKCKSWWEGGKYFYADDDYDAAGRLGASCFRLYDSPVESFHDHSAFLKYSERYAMLFALDRTDYVGWAMGLQQCGYATNPGYSKRLIQIIEKYDLYKLDTVSPGQ